MAAFIPPPVHAWPLPSYNRRRDLLLTPFGEAAAIPQSDAQIDQLAAGSGVTRERMIEVLIEEAEWPLFRNDLYQVQVRWEPETVRPRHFGPRKFRMPDLVHLSIKLIDKSPVHDWRHLQEIKSRLVGPEFEAMELYPAEDRVVDTANQYHLWVGGDPGWLRSIGFKAGVRRYEDGVGGSRQRALTP